MVGLPERKVAPKSILQRPMWVHMETIRGAEFTANVRVGEMRCDDLLNVLEEVVLER